MATTLTCLWWSFLCMSTSTRRYTLSCVSLLVWGFLCDMPTRCYSVSCALNTELRLSQHILFDSDKLKVLFVLLVTGFEPSTFWSPVPERYNHWAKPSPKKGLWLTFSTISNAFNLECHVASISKVPVVSLRGAFLTFSNVTKAFNLRVSHSISLRLQVQR